MKHEIHTLRLAVVGLFAMILFNGAIKPDISAPRIADQPPKRVEPVGPWPQPAPGRRMTLVVTGVAVDESIRIGPGKKDRLVLRLDDDGEPVIEFLAKDGKTVIGVITAEDARKPNAG